MFEISNILQLIQIAVIVLGGFITLGSIKERLNTVDKKVDKLETAFVQLARQDERINAMDQRAILTGRRVDRLENINARRKTKEDNEEEN